MPSALPIAIFVAASASTIAAMLFSLPHRTLARGSFRMFASPACHSWTNKYIVCNLRPLPSPFLPMPFTCKLQLHTSNCSHARLNRPCRSHTGTYQLSCSMHATLSASYPLSSPATSSPLPRHRPPSPLASPYSSPSGSFGDLFPMQHAFPSVTPPLLSSPLPGPSASPTKSSLARDQATAASTYLSQTRKPAPHSAHTHCCWLLSMRYLSFVFTATAMHLQPSPSPFQASSRATTLLFSIAFVPSILCSLQSPPAVSLLPLLLMLTSCYCDGSNVMQRDNVWHQ